MDNKISFTGIYNIGAMRNLVVDFRDLKPLDHKYLVAQIKNDKFGNDFDKYKNAVNSCEKITGKCVFPWNNEFIHIYTEKPVKKDTIPKLFLNFKEIPVCRETIKLYDFLGKLTRGLSHIRNDQYDIQPKFKYGQGGDMFIMGDVKITDICKTPEEYLQMVESIYNANSVKNISKMINNDIQIKMEDFLI